LAIENLLVYWRVLDYPEIKVCDNRCGQESDDGGNGNDLNHACYEKFNNNKSSYREEQHITQ